MAGPREFIDTGGIRRDLRRDARDRFTARGDVSRSLAADQNRGASAKARRGPGDRGGR